MDLRYPVEAESFRDEIRAFLVRELPDGWEGFGALEGVDAETWIQQWRETLAANRLIGLTWPVELGGGGRTRLDKVVLAEEFARAGVPTGVNVDATSVKMMGNTVLRWGTDEQKRRLVPRIVSGDDVWVQGYSEPGSGSDLASLSTTAVRDGDEWVITGQKVWTSRAELGNWMFLLARTDPEAPMHRGISFLLCPMDQPGVEVRPIVTLTGDAEFCEVFLDGARTAVGNILGEANGGWEVANSLLGLERGEEAATNPILFRAELDRVVELARHHGRLDDCVIRDRIAHCYTRVEIMRFLGYRILTQWLRDGDLGPAASISKLYWSEYHQEVIDLAIEIGGIGGLVRGGRLPYRQMRTDDPGAPLSTNSWMHLFLLNARSGTVYAGTSEVQRNILGERILGLPREPRPR